MKISKILASLAAAAVAATAMTFSAFAAVNKVEPVTLNSKNDDKVVQYNLGCFDVGEINTVQILGQLPADTWFGGGGALGFDSKDNGWVQVDFELGKDAAYTVDDMGKMDVTLTFNGDVVDMSKEDGIVQLGWWWGSGNGTVQISDIIVNGESIMGKEAAAPAPAETEAETDEADAEATEDEDTEAEVVDAEVDEVVEEDADLAVEEDDVVEEAAPVAEPVAEPEVVEEVQPVAETEAVVVETAPAADTTATAPVKTGNVAAVSIAFVMVAAGAATVVSKRK
ncbi:MAG: hypothetical protein K2N72_11830 [Oscillospiraceae bacterium]|nr:hypothetical protein [Oscillospiraceae bacterium]